MKVVEFADSLAPDGIAHDELFHLLNSLSLYDNAWMKHAEFLQSTISFVVCYFGFLRSNTLFILQEISKRVPDTDTVWILLCLHSLCGTKCQTGMLYHIVKKPYCRALDMRGY